MLRISNNSILRLKSRDIDLYYTREKNSNNDGLQEKFLLVLINKTPKFLEHYMKLLFLTFKFLSRLYPKIIKIKTLGVGAIAQL